MQYDKSVDVKLGEVWVPDPSRPVPGQAEKASGLVLQVFQYDGAEPRFNLLRVVRGNITRGGKPGRLSQREIIDLGSAFREARERFTEWSPFDWELV